MTRHQGKGKRILIWIVGIIFSVTALVLIGVNIYVRVAYDTLYSESEAEFDIPGTDSGFVCQDLDYCDANDEWYFSGYQASGGASPLFRLDADERYSMFTAQYPDGSTYEGHGSGITSHGNYVFLTSDEGYLVFNAHDFADVSDGGVVQAIDEVSLELVPAFLNVVSGSLYVGTFHLIPDYPAPDEHHMIASDGNEHAGIVFVYPLDESETYGVSKTAECVYSIPDAAQGLCALGNGMIMTSSSYGLSTSHLRTYDTVNLPQMGVFVVDGNEVPLYFLDSNAQVADLEAPPMTEGIELHDGRVYVSSESASNKYVFGKLYGAGRVYSIPAQG